MLGINYDANDWSMMFFSNGAMIPRCPSEGSAACHFDSIYDKCKELKLSGKECEPICEVKVKSAGWGGPGRRGSTASRRNVLCREGNTATWQLCPAILALYLGHWAAYNVDAPTGGHRDHPRRGGGRAAAPLRRRDAGLPENLREPAAPGVLRRLQRPGAGVRVVPCRHLSAPRAVEGRGRRATAAGGDDAPAAARDARRPPTRPPRTPSSSRPPARRRRPSRRPRRAASPEGGRARGAFGGDGGARSRPAFCEAPEVERADCAGAARALSGQGTAAVPAGLRRVHRRVTCCCSLGGRKIQNQAASPADARRRCEEARKAVADHAAEASPNGGSAIVVFSSLEIAQAAANCPLGASDAADAAHKGPTYREDKPHRKQEQRGRLVVALETAGYYLTGVQGCGWTKRKPPPMEVTPLPEPREGWGSSDARPGARREVGPDERGAAHQALRLVRLLGDRRGVCRELGGALQGIRQGRRRQCSRVGAARRLRAGLLPGWLFDYVAVILYNTNRMFNSLWSESSLQASVARDYHLLLDRRVRRVPALRHLGRHLERGLVLRGECDAAADEDEDEDADVDAASFNPSVAVRLMARAVPRHAWPFAAIFLMQIGDMAADCRAQGSPIHQVRAPEAGQGRVGCELGGIARTRGR